MTDGNSAEVADEDAIGEDKVGRLIFLTDLSLPKD
jgi:hypothetical protein